MQKTPGVRNRGAPSSRRKTWTVLSRREVYGSHWVTVSLERIELPDGRIIDDFHRVDFRDSVIIVARDAGQRTIMVRQYRHGYGRVTVALPAGAIDEGETPLRAAKRELLEETGYVANSWKRLGAYAADANYRCGLAHIFLAQGGRPCPRPPSASEDLEQQSTVLMPERDLHRAIRRKQVVSVGTLFALYLSCVLGSKDQVDRRRPS